MRKNRGLEELGLFLVLAVIFCLVMCGIVWLWLWSEEHKELVNYLYVLAGGIFLVAISIPISYWLVRFSWDFLSESSKKQINKLKQEYNKQLATEHRKSETAKSGLQDTIMRLQFVIDQKHKEIEKLKAEERLRKEEQEELESLRQFYDEFEPIISERYGDWEYMGLHEKNKIFRRYDREKKRFDIWRIPMKFVPMGLVRMQGDLEVYHKGKEEIKIPISLADLMRRQMYEKRKQFVEEEEEEE